VSSAQFFIDHILVHWGEDLLWETSPVRTDRRKKTPYQLNQPRQDQDRALKIRAHLHALVRKPPQVMVKITGGGADMKRISSHIDYVTRSGRYKKKGEEELNIETEDGLMVAGKEARDEIKDLFAMADAPIPTEIQEDTSRLGEIQKRKRREALNVIFSMPHGINRQAVMAAASATAKALFTNHHYMLVHHQDTDHQHTHVLVKMAGHDGQRLNPRKADLENWRIEFAQQLQTRGIDAQATRRRVRLERKKGVPQAIRQMRDRGVKPKHDRTSVSQPQAQEAARLSEEKTVRAYTEMAKALSTSSLAKDQELAQRLQEFIQAKVKRNPFRGPRR
jgi:hypothetical protein